MKNLVRIREQLLESKNSEYVHKFVVPTLWMEDNKSKTKITEINPYSFFIERIDRIFELSKQFEGQARSSRTVYNLFVRYGAAFDHNRDGDLDDKDNCFRDTGTFLKAIALLPYIKSLGTDTLYLLPITSIGQDGKKGNLGSPYSIRNPYSPDENLSEPMLELSPERQLSALIEAAHLLGMNVLLEFVFRTASLDSDLSLTHPEWFYWIYETGDKKSFKPPKFRPDVLSEIKYKVERGERSNLPVPDAYYTDQFAPTPKDVISLNGRVSGLTRDGKRVRIPNAFADWPPDDNQPLWSDVTYLKLFDNDEFNYIAYNTIRMYDEKIFASNSKIDDLWDYISNIIPHYISTYGIDGVMIDMGHALPPQLRKRITDEAKEVRNDFIFWEENFVPNKQSKDEGYDAVLGYMPFDFHEPNKLKEVIRRFERRDFPIDFFLTPETHNTKRAAIRAGGEVFAKAAWTISSFLPSIRFIHNGFELCEDKPVNTGLGFEPWEVTKITADDLPLFSKATMNWTGKKNIIDYIIKLNLIRGRILSEIGKSEFDDIMYVETNHESCVAFIANKKVLIIVNFARKAIAVNLDLPIEIKNLVIVSPENYSYKPNGDKITFAIAAMGEA